MTKKNEVKSEDPVAEKKRKKTNARKVMGVIVLAAVAVLGYKLWENPKLLYQLRDVWAERKAEQTEYAQRLETLQQQVNALQGRLAELAYQAANPDFSEMNKRIDDIEQISVNTIKSKADVEAVLGLVMRMDNAEGRLNDLGKVSDEGALTLTAAMLVKDAAQRGGPFVYEAEVLSELAAGNYKIAGEVAQINEIAARGVPSVSELQRQFAEIYANRYMAPAEGNAAAAEGWKDRIYQELNKVVQVRKTDGKTAEPEMSEEDRAWKIVSDYVAEGNIARAVAIIRKPLNAQLAADKNLTGWLEEAERYCDLYTAVSRISANALAVMKVKFLKNES